MFVRSNTEPLRGSLDLVVLKTLSLAPMHGWGISQRVQQTSNGMLEVNQGSHIQRYNASRMPVS